MDVLGRRKSQSPAIFAGGSEVSAGSLLEKVQLMARELKECGAEVVGLYSSNSIDWVVIDLACQLSGVCLIPIPTFFSSRQFSHVLHRAGVDTLIYGEPVPVEVVVDDAVKIPAMEQLKSLSVLRLKVERRAEIPAGCHKITFTSGSTGEPKGVCLGTEQCLAVAGSLAEVVELEEPRHLCLLPLSTLLENICGIYMPLLLGGSSIVVPPGELGMGGSSKLELPRLLQALDEWQPNSIILVPQLLAALDAAMAGGWLRPESLKFVAVGGGRVSASMVARVRDAGLPVYEGYGLSETGSVVSVNYPAAHKPGTCGKVLPHVTVRAENRELIVSGNTFLGYLNEPESWNREEVATGDLGEIDADGFVSVVGREKNVLISSFGRNISPEWVESELMGSGVFANCIVMGEARPYCVALVQVLDAQSNSSQVQVAIDSVNAGLPDYARIERWMYLEEPLSVENDLLTANGRPRRTAIESHYAERLESLYQLDQATINYRRESTVS
ncbi:MAG: long-chain acyl-CoA synthetase [Halieaceae bacterium]